MYKVTLHNLSSDATKAGANFGTSDLGEIDESRLLSLFDQFRKLDAVENNESDPRINIVTFQGRFHVRTTLGKLYLADLARPTEGAVELDSAGILQLISAQPVRQLDLEESPLEALATRRPLTNRILSTCMLVTGLALNGYTLYAAFYVDNINIAPPLTLITDKTEYVRNIEAIAGTYVTGMEKGDRGLVIHIDGTILVQELAEQGKVRKETKLGYNLGERDKKLFLAMKPKGQIEVLNRETVSLYGDTYHRIN